MERCVIGRVNRFTFPAPKDGGIVVSYPFRSGLEKDMYQSLPVSMNRIVDSHCHLLIVRIH